MMPALALPSFAILLCIALTVAMSMMSIYIVFTHQERQEEIDSWVDYSFSREMLGRAFHYYRWIGVSMIVVYVLFTISCLLLQAEGYVIFSDGKMPVNAGPIATSFFTIDLMLRGGLFDFMQHFDLRASHLYLNRQAPWFVWYSFVFRMYFGFTLVRLLFSLAWVLAKVRVMRQRQREASEQLKLFE
ncbi:MAG: hypothetical protein ABL904_03500 [Hyphomicrobiaceae bacterium]